MENFTEKQLRNQITKLEQLIGSRTGEFVGYPGDFCWFLKQGIAKELHSMTTSQHEGTKPDLRTMEDILFNMNMLFDIFDHVNKMHDLENQLSKLHCNQSNVVN